VGDDNEMWFRDPSEVTPGVDGYNYVLRDVFTTPPPPTRPSKYSKIIVVRPRSDRATCFAISSDGNGCAQCAGRAAALRPKALSDAFATVRGWRGLETRRNSDFNLCQSERGERGFAG